MSERLRFKGTMECAWVRRNNGIIQATFEPPDYSAMEYVLVNMTAARGVPVVGKLYWIEIQPAFPHEAERSDEQHVIPVEESPMHQRRKAPWVEIPPAWAMDLIDLNLIQVAQNEEILAALQKRDSTLSAQDIADLAEIKAISAETKRKLDSVKE